MKVILVIFMTFQFDATPVSEQIEFTHMDACYAARDAIIKDFKKPETGQFPVWGRPVMTATCVSRGTVP